MTVIYRGPLSSLGSSKGMSIQYGTGTIGSAVTFTAPFYETPAIFVVGTSDKHVYAASSATTGFTPTASSATSSGAGTTCNWLAIGRGPNLPGVRLFGDSVDLDYGACTIGSATTFSNGSYFETPVRIVGATSDEGVYVAGATPKTAFTPTAATGAGGSGTGADYISMGGGYNHKSLRESSCSGSQTAPNWVEVGTCASTAATTFYQPFLAIPKIIVRPISNRQFYAASGATTGFTTTTITLTGESTGTTAVYLAVGPKKM